MSSVCIVQGTTVHSLGYGWFHQWSYLNNDPLQGVVFYTEGDNADGSFGSCREATEPSSTVNFICNGTSYDSGDDAITITQYGSANGGGCDWVFAVNSMMVCQLLYPVSGGGGGDGGGSGSGLSGGSIFLIIFFVLLFIYCIVGMGYQVIFQGAAGQSSTSIISPQHVYLAA